MYNVQQQSPCTKSMSGHFNAYSDKLSRPTRQIGIKNNITKQILPHGEGRYSRFPRVFPTSLFFPSFSVIGAGPFSNLFSGLPYPQQTCLDIFTFNGVIPIAINRTYIPFIQTGSTSSLT